jgi:MFS family permease
MWSNIAILAFGFALAPLFTSGTAGTVVMMAIGMSLVGLVYGVIGTTLSELFPTTLRYSGTSLTFNLAAIFGASLAPTIATALAKHSLSYVGLYLSASAVLSLIGLAAARETRHAEL